MNSTLNQDGFLLIDKPSGITSRQACDRVKAYTDKKIGHTGTLDPMATGVMVLALGEATKFSQWIISADKAYDASIQLGAQTDTDDAMGETIYSSDVKPDAVTVTKALEAFVGTISQTPPRYSAIHHQGKRAYRLARDNKEFTLTPRSITIHQISNIGYDAQSRIVTCQITCQSGTYIRSIARDLGAELSCYGHLSALRRLWVSPFQQETCSPLTDLSDAKIITLENVFSRIAHIKISKAHASDLAYGRKIPLQANGVLAAFYQDTFIGMIEPGNDGLYRSKRLRSNILALL